MTSETRYIAKGNAEPDADLPPPDTKRWVASRKAVIVAAVRAGRITLEEACRRYRLSIEEFDAWRLAVETHGVPGLRATRVQVYRDVPRIRPAKPRRRVDGRPGAALLRSPE
jgi:hypothetical protein